MLNKISDRINAEIMDNALAATDWELHGLASELQWWIMFFNTAFFKEEPIPLPVLSFQETRVTTLGHYRKGRNDFGVKENINLNRLYLDKPLWEILVVLLHEMVHSWEHTYLESYLSTVGWYHKKGFSNKMKSFGILTDDKGIMQTVTDPFVHLLRQHGVPLIGATKDGPDYRVTNDKPKPKGRSKLKKWSCGCTNIRVAVKDFQALCLKCNNEFELAEFEMAEIGVVK